MTAAEITRNFGMWQDRATLTPVIVTHHGRARCVLLSASSYYELASASSPVVSAGPEGLLMQILAERIDPAFLVVDEQFCVRAANTAAAILLGSQREALLARPLAEMWADLENSVGQAQIRRAMRTSESAQVRCNVGDKAVVINVFPWPGGLGLLVRPVDGEESVDHTIAEAGAMHRLLMLDRHLGTVKLSMRGTISEPDPGFCTMIKIPPERLSGARLLDLASRASRAGLSEVIEEALSGAGEGECDAMLTDNDGEEIPVHLAITTIREGHGANSALVMLRDRRPC